MQVRGLECWNLCVYVQLRRNYTLHWRGQTDLQESPEVSWLRGKELVARTKIRDTHGNETSDNASRRVPSGKGTLSWVQSLENSRVQNIDDCGTDKSPAIVSEISLKVARQSYRPFASVPFRRLLMSIVESRTRQRWNVVTCREVVTAVRSSLRADDACLA